MPISAKVDRIIHEVKALSDDERDELMNALEMTDGDDVSEEWREELQARVQDMDDGRVKTIPHDEVLKRLHEDLRLQRENHE